MLRSLKVKLMLAFGTLMVVLFAIMGLFLLDAKTKELSSDISESTQVFAQFTVQDVMTHYHDYLEPGNFVPFTREISGLMSRSDDISNLSITTYSGVILYNREEESTAAYTGTLRIADSALLERIQGNKTSLLLESGRVLYTLVDENKSISYVDFNEKPVTSLSSTDRIFNIVVPHENAYAVVYEVSYATLDARLLQAQKQIALIAGVGMLLTLMIAFMLSVSITKPLHELKEGAIQIAGGRFDTRVPVRTKDEVGILAFTFNQMASDLAASIEAKIYKERVTKELELAAKIQEDLLPKTKLELATLDVAGGLDPATEIGGDAFDFIPMNDGNTLIYLGDGTGHGVAAGIMSSISNALLYAFRGETDLKKIATAMNEVIQNKSVNTMFITMALTIWNEANSSLKYLNAGHLPLLYFDASASKLTEVKLPGIAFGMVDDISTHVSEQEVKLEQNDVIVLYSDGIPDAQNERNEAYGMMRLKQIVQGTANDLYSAEAIKNAILADVAQFVGTREHLDDMTVVVMKRK